MSRESEFRHKYGVFGAGPVSRTLVGSLAAQAGQIGPISAASYRVASRLANTLKSGFAVRDAGQLRSSPVILFYAPEDQVVAQLAVLHAAALDWTGRSLILCNCRANPEILAPFGTKGAAVATIREFGVAGFVAIHGAEPARAAGMRITRLLHLRAIEIATAADPQFDAAVTLSTAIITPLIFCAATLLQGAGAREADASRLASALVEQTARGYSLSGRQSWEWYIHTPDARSLQEQIAGSGEIMQTLFRELLLLGFDCFGKHPEVARIIAEAAKAESA
jgi:hypothetical protein